MKPLNTRAASHSNRPARAKPGKQKLANLSPYSDLRALILIPKQKWLLVFVCITLTLAILAVYGPTFRHGFILYDDDHYVLNNFLIKSGLTLYGVTWAFTTFFYANWHPLTWLSYMLDSQVFGLNAGAYHVVNVLLHIGATLLLFYVLTRMTHHLWRSTIVAGIFAVHPLHVESVAWISERKDVLSAVFAMLTLLLYTRYSERRTIGRYVLMATSFAAGLMAKPMLVTLPLVLLLLDFWPLGRLEWPLSWPLLKTPLLEKLLLIAMAAITSILTVLAQRKGGAVIPFERLPFPARLANAATSYVKYLGKSFWPAKLAVLYPYKPSGVASVAAALAVIAAVTIACLLLVRSRPYLLVGWLWFVGMLVPVSGLVQVGTQSMADRYMYLPLIGLSIAVVWGFADSVEGRRLLTRGAVVLAPLVLLLLAIQSYRQTGYWRDSQTLFEHTLAVTKDNPFIHNNLGLVLAAQQKHDEAITHYREAIAIQPDYADAHANLGDELLRSGRSREAFEQLNQALRLKPDPITHADLGILLAGQGKFEEAKQHLSEALRSLPKNAGLHSNLCFVLQKLRDIDGAIRECKAALSLDRDLLDAHVNLASALAAKGQVLDAYAELRFVLARDPNNAGAHAVYAQIPRIE